VIAPSCLCRPWRGERLTGFQGGALRHRQRCPVRPGIGMRQLRAGCNEVSAVDQGPKRICSDDGGLMEGPFRPKKHRCESRTQHIFMQARAVARPTPGGRQANHIRSFQERGSPKAVHVAWVIRQAQSNERGVLGIIADHPLPKKNRCFQFPPQSA